MRLERSWVDLVERGERLRAALQVRQHRIREARQEQQSAYGADTEEESQSVESWGVRVVSACTQCRHSVLSGLRSEVRAEPRPRCMQIAVALASG